MIGGQPKCGKTWLGLEIAVSVAPATPCLRCYAVDDPGPALVYLAEDAAADVRARVDGICQRRNLAIESLDLFLITVPALRLDTPTDCGRLVATAAELRPRLVLRSPPP
ncbi:MAG: AAA family ATPase [Candidatus Schekmanbacteria bacterium]|nr:AAA family ATPase [Candidatus Schekmanbacteria bacterium]